MTPQEIARAIVTHWFPPHMTMSKHEGLIESIAQALIAYVKEVEK